MKNIIENAKEIASLIKKYNDQELYEKIVDLREQILELRNENLTLKQELNELKQSASIEDSLEYEQPYYWKKSNGKKVDGPFCQHCYDKDEKLIRLQESRKGLWTCLVCEATVYDKNYEPPPQQPETRSKWMDGLDAW